MLRHFLRTVLAGLVVLLLFTPSAHANPTAYLITGSQQWGILDLNSGVFTLLGSTGVQLAGIGSYGGNMYGGSWQNDTLYRINISNGALTTIGNGSTSYFGFGSNPTGLYLYDKNDTGLYSISPNSGASTLVGFTGVAPGLSWGMSSGPAGLYLAMDYGAGSILYQLNTSTGAVTMIGNTGVPGIGAMVWANGVLYAGENYSPYSVWTLDPLTGQGTFVTNASANLIGAFWGLAAAAVPEPSSLLLLGSGVAAAAAVVRRRLVRR